MYKMILSMLILSMSAVANEVEVVDATIESLGGDRFRINVTLLHADTGWDHYADRWDVLDEAGELLGSRTLHHPHVNEQPFTRSLTLSIPANVKTVTIVAHDSVHKLGPDGLAVSVPDR